MNNPQQQLHAPYFLLGQRRLPPRQMDPQTRRLCIQIAVPGIVLLLLISFQVIQGLKSTEAHPPVLAADDQTTAAYFQCPTPPPPKEDTLTLLTLPNHSQQKESAPENKESLQNLAIVTNLSSVCCDGASQAQPSSYQSVSEPLTTDNNMTSNQISPQNTTEAINEADPSMGSQIAIIPTEILPICPKVYIPDLHMLTFGKSSRRYIGPSGIFRAFYQIYRTILDFPVSYLNIQELSRPDNTQIWYSQNGFIVFAIRGFPDFRLASVNIETEQLDETKLGLVKVTGRWTDFTYAYTQQLQSHPLGSIKLEVSRTRYRLFFGQKQREKLYEQVRLDYPKNMGIRHIEIQVQCDTHSHSSPC